MTLDLLKRRDPKGVEIAQRLLRNKRDRADIERISGVKGDLLDELIREWNTEHPKKLPMLGNANLNNFRSKETDEN